MKQLLIIAFVLAVCATGVFAQTTKDAATAPAGTWQQAAAKQQQALPQSSHSASSVNLSNVSTENWAKATKQQGQTTLSPKQQPLNVTAPQNTGSGWGQHNNSVEPNRVIEKQKQ